MGAKTIRCSLTALCAAPAMWGVSASAAPSVVIDVASGQILQQEQATQAWYPASLTKLMTVYVALDAVRTQRLTLDTPLLVSPGAVKMAPTKMGFRPGSEVTLRNALVMLMVKSANDIAVTIAEGVSGSVDAFADEMNKAAASLGMQESHWVNPNGLPDARQVTSARDLAILGRALYLQFPESAGLFNIGAMKLGSRIIPTHNGLLGRYPGADGMKTGFTCPAGFNLVASATHGGQRLIAVVLGAPSASARTAKAASLLDRAFMTGSAMGSIAALPTFGVAAAPDLRDSVEPVPVYVGRPSGYEGPVAGARDPGAPLGTLSPTAYAGEKTEGAEAAGAPIAHGVASMRRHAASKPHAHTAHLHGKPRHGAKHATTKQPHKVVVAKVEKHAVGHHGSKRQAAGKEQ
ncbi:MAG: D-alanyl-D-alanine carboxypeptidase [Methylocystis sp.]|nr:D-alanyl-D-alanine carboxypeptidase [Methylocystis sp.]